jgi:hypothetical protein
MARVRLIDGWRITLPGDRTLPCQRLKIPCRKSQGILIGYFRNRLNPEEDSNRITAYARPDRWLHSRIPCQFPAR